MALTPRDDASAAVSARPRPRILLVGDSLLVEATPHVKRLADKAGVAVDIQARKGTAICDWVGAMPGIRARFKPQIAVLAFSGNNLTPCVKDARGRGLQGSSLGVRYYYDIEAMSGRLNGLEVFWVQPPARKWWTQGAQAVTAAYADATRWRPDARLIEGGALISPGRVWSETQPCLPEEPCTGPKVSGVRHNVVRGADGLHFCPSSPGFTAHCDRYASGAYRYARAILLPVVRELGRTT